MDFDAKAATWDDDPQKVERARRVAEAILAQVSGTERMSVLEYGCGTGLLGFALRPHVARVTMADSSPGMLQVLRRKIEASGLGGMASLRLDLAVDPPPAGRWDLVCTLMTLHHVRDVDALLRSFHAVLAPRGIACIADLDREDGSFHGAGADVHRGFDRDDLAGRLARAGFGGARFTTAFEIQKAAAGAARTYPVFLAVAERARGGSGAPGVAAPAPLRTPAPSQQNRRMLCIFEVKVATGHDPDALLSEEALRETQAQVMTLEQARAVGFSGALPDAGGHEVRLVAVAPRDSQFVQRRLEANDAVLSFRLHEVEA